MRWLVVLAVVVGCGGRARSPEAPAAAADRFERVHRLVDLYDTARFAKSAEARTALGRELGFAVGTGPAATEKVIAALEIEVDRVLAADRLHAGGQAAKTLLDFDGKPPAARAEVLQRMREVKAIARGSGPMAPNARLRLAGYCWRALDDATRAPWRQRPFAIAHCLYPLYDSDPEAYFDRDPDRRPPTPGWRDLIKASHDLIRGEGALDAARSRLYDTLSAIEKDSAAEMPIEPASDVDVTGVPLYDWTPVATPATPADALRERIQGDGRGQVALEVRASGQGEILAMANVARAAGASEIQLVGGRRQRLEVPPGDYWHGRRAEMRRAAVVPISLAPLGPIAANGGRNPYAVDFSAGLRLALIIGAHRWRLVGESGELLSVESDGVKSPSPALVEALLRVRAAFPEQQALALVIEPGAPNGHAIAAGAAAAWRDGKPFFRLGLAANAPAVKGNALARRVALRAGASVAIVPDTLAARKPALLACYQDALERAPKLAGAVRVEPKDGKAVAVGAADRKLAACATAALGKALIASGVASAEVTFRVSGSH